MCRSRCRSSATYRRTAGTSSRSDSASRRRCSLEANKSCDSAPSTGTLASRTATKITPSPVNTSRRPDFQTVWNRHMPPASSPCPGTVFKVITTWTHTFSSSRRLFRRCIPVNDKQSSYSLRLPRISVRVMQLSGFRLSVSLSVFLCRRRMLNVTHQVYAASYISVRILQGRTYNDTYLFYREIVSSRSKVKFCSI